MSGKTSTSTSTVQVPADVLARYDAVNSQAQAAANTPFQQYSTDPNAFVAPLSATQQSGIQNTNTAANQAQPYYGQATSDLLAAQGQGLGTYSQAVADQNRAEHQAQPLYSQSNADVASAVNNSQPYNDMATGLAMVGTQQVNPQQIGANQINQFMSPYLSDVVGSEAGLLNQNNQQAMAGQLGNAINSGAFGGDRAGIAAANLSQQQNLANANIYSGLLNTGYNTALGAAQQQQGVNLSAGQANRAALQQGATQLEGIGQQEYTQGMGQAQQLAANAQGLAGIDTSTAAGLGALGTGEYNIGAGTANSLAGLGTGAQSAALQGATAQLTAGQQEQSTQQAGLTALYNQFLQQQAYPFQTAQFAANVAEGTGSLSGSTTSTTQPTGLFGNLLSDRRAKEDIKEIGKAKNGLKIYTFKYKGDPEKVTHIGFMADEVEKKHPEAVGLAGGLKTVDYERASKAGGGGLVFDPNAGEYGLGALSMPGSGTYVPAPQQSAARRIAFQHSPNPPQMQGLGQLASQYQQLKGLYNDGSQIYDTGKNVVSGLGAAMPQTYSHGGLALKRDDGGIVDDPFESDLGLQQREKGLVTGEGAIEQAPNSAANGPVSGALASQATSPKYSLGSTPQAANSNSSGSGLAQLAALATLSKDVAPYAVAALGLNAGGLVPREHHADGDSVGDDDINPHGDAPVTTTLTPNEMYAKQKASGLAPTTAHSDAAATTTDGLAGANATTPPMISPDDVNALPDFDASKLKGPQDIAVPPGLFKKPAPAPSQGGVAPPTQLHPAATANVAPSAAQAGLGAWAAPTYDGPRPNAAPDPANYGTDRAGQAAFIRDYAAYRGVRPDFALGVANAEGLRAISPQNPNGASSVDIDPNTGKPFSFGAFQLNVRNGLGNVAMAHGIDPTNPDHANLANKFAIDQMATGGLKPWRGDAAVNAYQHGLAAPTYANAGNAAPAGASPQGQPQQAQQPGLFDSLGKFFHGQPDGQSSPNGGMGERALMGVLSGLGAIGSYRGQSVLGAALQGLGAGAQGYMNAGKTQADIAEGQARAGREEVGTVQDAVKGMFTIGPDGRPMLKGDYMNNPGAVAGSAAIARRNGVPLPTGPQYNAPAPGLAPPPAPAPVAPPSASVVAPAAPAADTTAAPPAPPSNIPPAALGDVGKASVARDFAQARTVAGDEDTMKPFLAKNQAVESAVEDRYNAAHTQGANLNQLGKELSDLSQDGSSLKPGPLQAWKQTLASQWNSIIGDSPTAQQYKVNPEEIGTAEAAHKMTLGMSFARASSNHQNTIEALETANAATPNASITPAGIRKIMASMYADKQRDIDQYNYLQQYKDYARAAGGTGKANWYNPQNAIAAFNKEHNDTEYANLRNAIERSWKDSYKRKTGEVQSRAAGAIQGQIGSNAIDSLYNTPGLHRVYEND